MALQANRRAYNDSMTKSAVKYSGVIALSLAFACAQALAQGAPPASPQRPHPEVQVKRFGNLKIATWEPDSPACDQWLYRGMVYKKMASNGLVITAMLGDFSPSLGVMVVIQNAGAARVVVDPSSWVVFEIKPDRKTLPYVAPEKLAGSIRRHARWAAALTAMAGAFESAPSGSESGTFDGTTEDGQEVSGDYGGTITHNGPDAAQQAETDRRVKRIRSRSASAQQQLLAGAILPTTLLPGRTLQGMVYFKRAKHVKLAALDIKIGGVIYRFMFVYR